LRKAIELERRNVLSRIAHLQRDVCQRYLDNGFSGSISSPAVGFLDDLRVRFLALPAWPQLRPVTRGLSLIAGSQYVLVIAKAALPLVIK